jgi:hypothetical protein
MTLFELANEHLSITIYSRRKEEEVPARLVQYRTYESGVRRILTGEKHLIYNLLNINSFGW